MIGIYKITSPSNRIYIGQTIDSERRIREYKLNSCKSQPRLYSSLKKYGFNNHIFEIIEECDVSILNERERYWQEYYDVLSQDKGLNCILTKSVDKKMVHSKDTRIKISEKLKGKMSGKDNPFYGRRHTQETKDKISKRNKGRIVEKGVNHFNYGKKQTKETIEKRKRMGDSHYLYGKKHTQEVICKIKKTKIGKQTLGDNPNSKIVIDISTGMIFYSLKELSYFISISYDILRYSVRKESYRYQYLR